MFQRNVKKIIFKYVQKGMFLYAKKIICCSVYARGLLREAFGIDKNVYYLHVPFISIKHDKKAQKKQSLSKENKSDLIFLSPSRIEPRKGIHLLIEAIRFLKIGKNKKITVYIIGPLHNRAHTYFIRIYNAISSINQNIHVFFRNEITDKNQLYRYYLSADAVLMPSINLETLGMVTLEALSLGIPVLGMPTSATKEVLSQIDKRLIANEITPSALARRMEWFTRLSPKSRSILRQKCLYYTRKFHSPKKTLADFQKIFPV